MSKQSTLTKHQRSATRGPSHLIAAIFAVTALCVGAAGPVGAQFGVLTIDPHEGAVGSVVEGFVDTGVVAEACPMTVEEIGAQFWADSGVSGDGATDPGPVFADYLSLGSLVGFEPPADGVWPGTEIFPGSGFWVNGFGPPPAGVEPEAWAWRYYSTSSFGFVVEDQEQNAALQLWVLMSILGGGDWGNSGVEAQAAYLPQTFILTFADIATQEPVGETSNFDASTGVGQVNVPEVESGLWAVAATCVIPTITEESFLDAVAVGAEFMETNEIPIIGSEGATANATGLGLRCFEPRDVPNATDPNCEVPMVLAVGGVMLRELMAPIEGAGPWVDIYCVLDADGQCHPDLRDVALAELLGVEDPDAFLDVEDRPALPVGASPRFTG